MIFILGTICFFICLILIFMDFSMCRPEQCIEVFVRMAWKSKRTQDCFWSWCWKQFSSTACVLSRRQTGHRQWCNAIRSTVCINTHIQEMGYPRKGFIRPKSENGSQPWSWKIHFATAISTTNQPTSQDPRWSTGIAKIAGCTKKKLKNVEPPCLWPWKMSHQFHLVPEDASEEQWTFCLLALSRIPMAITSINQSSSNQKRNQRMVPLQILSLSQLHQLQNHQRALHPIRFHQLIWCLSMIQHLNSTWTPSTTHSWAAWLIHLASNQIRHSDQFLHISK